MRILGTEFVLGRTIEEALKRSSAGQSYSYDMLGEAARDGASAERYFGSYMHAVESLRAAAKQDAALPPSVSVKLSALHPRYEYAQRERVLAELGSRLIALANAPPRSESG